MVCAFKLSGRLAHAFGLALLFALSVPAVGSEITAEYTGDVLRNLSGGIDRGTRYLDKLDVAFRIDSSPLPGESAGSLFGRLLYTNGTNFSEDLVGDLQIVSNIDAYESWRIFELWYEFIADNWSLKAGLYDLNSEFDVNNAGALFLNSSHGIGVDLGQTGRNGPGIYPVSSTALRAALNLERLTARVVVMDGVPGNPDDPSSNRVELDDDEGVLSVAELDLAISDSTRFWSGYWRYTADFEHAFDHASCRSNDGWYAGLESNFALGSRSAAFFARVGKADERFNVFGGYVGLGIVVDGPFAARPYDQFGVALASGRAGGHYREYLGSIGAVPRRHETAWEMTYKARVTEYLVIQPNVQYVQNPSASGSVDNAWVIALRFHWSVLSAEDS
jgi:porin